MPQTKKPAFQVTCHTPDNLDRDRRLQGLGGPENGGWYGDIDTIIAEMQADKYDLWTITPQGESVWVYVVSQVGRKPFLTTQPDGREPNNLLALPPCR